jgi:Ger(x)C family germination protein
MALLILIFLPGVLVGDLDSKTDAIITSVGIDKNGDNGYEVSLQYVVPTPSGQFNKKVDVLSSKNGDISATIADLSLKLGKPIGFSHCQSIVISQDVTEGDIAKIYDYFVRFELNTNYIALIYTPQSAKDFLNASADTQNSLAISMGGEGEFSNVNLRGMQTFLSDFYIGYFSPSGCSRMGCIDVKEEPSSGSSGGDQSSSGSEGGSSGSGSEGGGGGSGGGKKKIVNEGKAIVLKHGKKVRMLEKEEVIAFGWFFKDTASGNIMIEHVTGEQYKDATVGVEIVDKSSNVKAYFEDGAPIYELKVKVRARVAEVKQDGYTLDNFHMLKENVNKVLKAAITEKIEEDFNTAITLSQENNFDIIEAYDTFYKFRTRQFKKFLDNLPNIDEYIKHITFKVTVDVQGSV